jgi:uncharacterized protein (DUF3084 family)
MAENISNQPTNLEERLKGLEKQLKFINDTLDSLMEGQRALTVKTEENAWKARTANMDTTEKLMFLIETVVKISEEKFDMKIDKLETALNQKIDNGDKIVMAHLDLKTNKIQESLENQSAQIKEQEENIKNTRSHGIRR